MTEEILVLYARHPYVLGTKRWYVGKDDPAGRALAPKLVRKLSDCGYYDFDYQRCSIPTGTGDDAGLRLLERLAVPEKETC